MTTPAVTEPTTTPPAPPATPASPEGATRFNPDEIIDEMIEEKGGGLSGARLAAKKLLRDKGKLLEKVARLRARVVEEGAVVLKGDELAAYNKLRGLGLTAEQIADIKKERDTFAEEVKGAKQSQVFEAAGEALGLPAKGRKAFARLAAKDSIEVQFKDIEVEKTDGSKGTKRVAFARVGGTGDFAPLDAVLENEYGEFLPALYAADDDDSVASPGRSGDSGPSRGHAPERKATPMPEQRGSARTSGEKSELGVVERTLARSYAPRKAT